VGNYNVIRRIFHPDEYGDEYGDHRQQDINYRGDLIFGHFDVCAGVVIGEEGDKLGGLDVAH
jgi:hypothetical protein